MNGQASNVNIAATASEVRHLRSLVVKFLTWHSNFFFKHYGWLQILNHSLRKGLQAFQFFLKLF